MNLFKKRFKQFKEYLSLKNKEYSLNNQLKLRYKEKNIEDNEYEEFKRTIIHTVDDMFYKGKTKIIIKPKASQVHLFERLLNDSDFTNYYKSRVISGSELEVQLIEI